MQFCYSICYISFLTIYIERLSLLLVACFLYIPLPHWQTNEPAHEIMVRIRWAISEGSGDLAEIQTHPRIYDCPGYLQVWWRSDQNWRHSRSDKVKYGLFRLSRASNSSVKSLIWLKFELIREFMAVLMTCKFDEDLIKIKCTIDRMSNMGFFSTRGQETLTWTVWCGWNSSEILWLSWLPARLDQKWSRYRSDKVNYGLFRLSRASNSEVNSLIPPKFELLWEFMAVPVICKFDEDPIKIEGTINWTRSNMGFFVTQGQVTPKWIVRSGRNSYSSEILWLSWLSARLMKFRSKSK